MELRKCKNCEETFEINVNNKKSLKRKFCSSSCSASFNNKLRLEPSDEQREKVSESLKQIWLVKLKDDWSKKIGETTKGKHNSNVNSIYDVSKRTMQKMIKRLNINCLNCGWDKTTCDIHHINGRKIENCHHHSNLTLLCPNCHRMVHEGKLDKKKLKTLLEVFPENWLDYYYG
jgi:hypothetical protein